MKRLVALLPVLVALQVGVQPALAWTWPVDGPVLRPFVLGDDPYAAGQHRGIDVGATAGAPVRAPAAGTVSFAGTVPGGGRTVTVRTADGYAVTLLHLGSIGIGRGDTVAEGEAVGSVGPSGDAELDRPYVHLGVRLAANPNGYVDPLTLLPARPAPAEPAEEPVPVEEPAPIEEQPDQPPAEDLPPVGEAPTRVPRVRAGGADSPSHRARRSRALVQVGRHRAEPRGGQRLPARRRSLERPPAPSRSREAPRGFDRPLTATEWARSGAPAGLSAHAGGAGSMPPSLQWLLAAALAAAGGACLAVLLGKLRDAAPTDPSPPVLLDHCGLAAEDARGPGLAEQNRLVFDRDLEWILLHEAESFSDLDRDDDSSELVQVADDSGRRLSPCAHRRAYRAPIPWSGHSRGRVVQAR
jgi:hypothetical protein